MAKSLQSLHGHKTEQSFKAYVDTDLEDHRHISTLLSNQRPLVKKTILAKQNPGTCHIPLLHSLGSTIVVSTLGALAVHHRLILK